MYLGHSFLAFAVVVTAGHLLDLDRRRVLVLGGLAAGYGLLPDVDVWRTLYVFLRSGPDDVFPTEQHVWAHSWVVHRALTHSVLTGGTAAIVSGLAVRASGGDSTRARIGAATAIALAAAVLLAFAARSAGTAGLVTVGLFLGGAVGLAVAGSRRGATTGGVAAVAAVGLLAHPFGDLWMGRPPALLAPVVSEPPLGEATLSSDPVLHFLAAVAVELALLGACVHLLCALGGRRVREYLSPLALVGVGYAAVLGRVPPPTFAEAYQFSTGLFGLSVAVAILAGRLGRGDGPLGRGFVTGVAAFALGLAAYAAAYALAA